MTVDLETKFNMYGTILYKICIVMMANESDAEDAVQDTFLKYIKKKPEFEGLEHERAWFIRVAVNVCKDMLRARKWRTTVDIDDLVELTRDEPEPFEKTETFEQILTLPPKYKTVIYLYYAEGYKVEEIARMIGASASAVKMRLKRGRGMLKMEMETED